MTASRILEAHCVWAAQAGLGEGPLWVAAEDAVYWVDIERGQILRYFASSGYAERCTLPEPVSAIARMADGRLLCTAQRSIHAFDPRSGRIAPLAHPELPACDIRINDACVHPSGALWFGTMDLAESAAVGDFHYLTADGSCMQMPVSYAITNGPAFSPDGDIGYFVDTVQRRIFHAPISDGMFVAPLQPFAEFGEDDGYPDGLAVDVEGGVWCAHWGGSRVTRYDPDGRISDTVHLPVSNVTKCAFGGERLDRLFITTARKGLDAAALAAQPLAGGLFEIDVDYRGLPPSRYSGTTSADAAEHVCVFKPT